MKPFISFSLLVGVICFPVISCGVDTAAEAAKIDKLVSEYVDRTGFTGTILVSEHDKVLFERKAMDWKIASGTSPMLQM